MKSFGYLLAAGLLGLLLGTGTHAAEAGTADKGNANQRGGRAAERMSDKAVLNNNSQWSADPEHGWVRAEERHKMRDERRSTINQNKKGRGNSKSKGKANKS
jgi:hypothetical protein